MNVTPKEATGIRCCVPGVVPPGDCCISVNCMGWKWLDDEYEYAINPNDNTRFFKKKIEDSPAGDGWEEYAPLFISPLCVMYRRPLGPARRGYCGRSDFDVIVELPS